uniref:Putative secreted protein n=1 Tax=Amblyomma americanum TaxID=6943 RepID=A0A0C9RX33_AMBAM
MVTGWLSWAPCFTASASLAGLGTECRETTSLRWNRRWPWPNSSLGAGRMNTRRNKRQPLCEWHALSRPATSQRVPQPHLDGHLPGLDFELPAHHRCVTKIFVVVVRLWAYIKLCPTLMQSWSVIHCLQNLLGPFAELPSDKHGV